MSEAEQSQLRVGSVVGGRFRLTGVLGRGSDGPVYRARQPAIDREVAIKLLPASRARDPEARARFAAEAKIIGRLRSPNTVALHDYGRLPDGTFYIVMELVEGRTLERIIADGDHLDAESCGRIFTDVAASLSEAHELGIVHRDVKPANVVIQDSDGAARVLDFGVSKLLEQAVSWTQEGVVIGTPAYMAPELWASEVGPVSFATDIYALGVMLYEALTGRRPFVGETPAQMMNAHLNEDPAPLPSSAPHSKTFDAVIARCLAKRPADRYRSVGAFADALRCATTERRANVRPWIATAIVGLVAVAGISTLDEPGAKKPSEVASLETPKAGPTPHTLVVGDFNGDGLADLVTGDAKAQDGGRFFVSYGAPDDTLAGGRQFALRDVPGEADEPDAEFGAAIASGNFNGDQFDDLAVGVPHRDTRELEDAGGVVVFYGTASGLTDWASVVFDQDDVASATNEAGDHFGAALAVGDFNNDTFDDLAIGAPEEDTWEQEDAGMIAIAFGGDWTMDRAPKETISENAVLDATPKAGDRFGAVLVAGDFNGDAHDDLAVAAPHPNSTPENPAEVSVIYGSAMGLYPVRRSDTFNQAWIFGHSSSKDESFGYSVVAADVDADGCDDLVLGSDPSPTLGPHITVIFGSQTRLLLRSPVSIEHERGDGQHLSTGDVNGDGFADIVATVTDRRSSSQSFVTIVFGGPKRSLTDRTQRLAGPTGYSWSEIVGPHNPVTGDFDRDGFDEVTFGIPIETIRTSTGAAAARILTPLRAR